MGWFWFKREQVNPKLFPGWYLVTIRLQLWGKTMTMYFEVR